MKSEIETQTTPAEHSTTVLKAHECLKKYGQHGKIEILQILEANRMLKKTTDQLLTLELFVDRCKALHKVASHFAEWISLYLDGVLVCEHSKDWGVDSGVPLPIDSEGISIPFSYCELDPADEVATLNFDDRMGDVSLEIDVPLEFLWNFDDAEMLATEIKTAAIERRNSVKTNEDIQKEREAEEAREARYRQYLKLKEEFDND